MVHEIESRIRGAYQLAIRVMATPADTNGSGHIFGGWLMSQVDIAGSTVAVQMARGRVVTAAVNNFQFLGPVFVGDLVSCYAEVTKTGRTSIRVDIEALAERGSDPASVHRVAEATLTYVAVDEDSRPRTVPNLSSDPLQR